MEFIKKIILVTMNIETLKKEIELNTLSDDILIFVYKDSDFLVNQYVSKISNIRGCRIKSIESISDIYSTAKNIFGLTHDTYVYVLRCNKLSYTEEFNNIALLKNVIILCTDIDDSFAINSNIADRITTFPALEDWMIKDYAYSLLEGADTRDIDTLISLTGNIERLSMEIEKIRLFNSSQYRTILKDILTDSTLSDCSTSTIFTLSNAIQNKDCATIKRILLEISNIDIEPIGLVRVLSQTFRKLIIVWLNSNPTPENTGLKSNQIYAINKLNRCYSKSQLISIYRFMLTLENKLKLGYISNDELIDYIIIGVLSI